MAHILVAGLGAMGGLWAARLARHHQVSVITRLTQAEHLTGRIHIQLVTPEGALENTEFWVYGRSTCLPEPDLILVTCKSWQTRELMAQHPLIKHPPCPLVILQNGLATQQACSDFSLPVLAASTTEAAFRQNKREIRHVARGETRLGALNSAAEPYLESTTRLMADSGLTLTACEDIRAVLWEKLCINCGINPFTALTGMKNGDILAHPLYLTHIDTLCDELARACGWAGYPATASILRRKIEQVAQATRENVSSMLADVRAGRPTEIDAMNGFVAKWLDAAGESAPVNTQLTELVKALTAET